MALAGTRMQDAPVGDLDPGSVVRKLALEAALCDVRLPSFPDIAMRVRQVLEDLAADDCQRMLAVTVQQIKSLHAVLSGCASRQFPASNGAC